MKIARGDPNRDATNRPLHERTAVCCVTKGPYFEERRAGICREMLSSRPDRGREGRSPAKAESVKQDASFHSIWGLLYTTASVIKVT